MEMCLNRVERGVTGSNERLFQSRLYLLQSAGGALSIVALQDAGVFSRTTRESPFSDCMNFTLNKFSFGSWHAFSSHSFTFSRYFTTFGTTIGRLQSIGHIFGRASSTMRILTPFLLVLPVAIAGEFVERDVQAKDKTFVSPASLSTSNAPIATESDGLGGLE